VLQLRTPRGSVDALHQTNRRALREIATAAESCSRFVSRRVTTSRGRIKQLNVDVCDPRVSAREHSTYKLPRVTLRTPRDSVDALFNAASLHSIDHTLLRSV